MMSDYQEDANHWRYWTENDMQDAYEQLGEVRDEIAALRETISRLEREKGMLVAVAEAAREYQVAIGTRWGGDSDMAHLLKLGTEFNDAREAAIDGGALGDE